jgi:hypothetical protein
MAWEDAIYAALSARLKQMSDQEVITDEISMTTNDMEVMAYRQVERSVIHFARQVNAIYGMPTQVNASP